MKRHELAAASGGFHAVRFYHDDAALCRMVADFLSDGLTAAQPGIIVATPAHRDRILGELHDRGFDVARLTAERRLISHDAQGLLDTILEGGVPAAHRFDDAIEPLLPANHADDDTRVARVYGEMVDLLWRAGEVSAATRLEMLWNTLATRRQFSLLCAYTMGRFLKDAAVGDICRLHTHVFDETGDPLRVQ